MRPNVVTIPHVTDYRRSEREDRPRARSARVRGGPWRGVPRRPRACWR